VGDQPACYDKARPDKNEIPASQQRCSLEGHHDLREVHDGDPQQDHDANRPQMTSRAIEAVCGAR
jgi:hypothetical protein